MGGASKFDLQERLIAFAVIIVNLFRNLPATPESRYYGGQLLRSGGAPALLYAEAQAAESRKDFIHKLKLCQKELRETGVNLRIIDLSGIAASEVVRPIASECKELNAIIFSSIRTAQSNTDK